MKIHQHRRIPVSLVLGSIVCLFSLPARADVVYSDAAFYNFVGVLSTGGQFTSTINGNSVCPDAGCGPDTGIATVVFYDPITDTGNPVQTVDFSLTDIYATPTQRPPNSLTLTGVDYVDGINSGQNIQIGDTTVVARLRYVNGQWFSGPQLDFSISAGLLEQTVGGPYLGYDVVQGSGGTWDDTLQLTVTPNTGTAANNADSVCFTNHPTWNCFYAYEPGDTSDPYAEVELLAAFGSLTPVGFGNAISGGFVAPAQVVPVPAAAWLFASGLAGLFGIVRRKRPSV